MKYFLDNLDRIGQLVSTTPSWAPRSGWKAPVSTPKQLQRFGLCSAQGPCLVHQAT